MQDEGRRMKSEKNKIEARCGMKSSSFILHPSAFTLVELMVAIALVLVLMLGVSRVFTATTQTVGAGQSVSDNTRDARAAQAVMAQDMLNFVQDAPFIMIRSRPQVAFRNRSTELSDRDGNALTSDVNADGDESDPEDLTTTATYNARNHRVDMMVFFTRGLQRRQTGNELPAPGILAANQTCYEQYVSYGHLRIDGTGVFATGATVNPGEGNFQTNPDNFYATQWILGRIAIQMRDRDSNGQILDNSTPGVPQDHFRHNTGASPFTLNSSTAVYGTGGPVMPPRQIQDCRYDLAGVSISAYTQIWQSYLSTTPGGWDDLVGIEGRFQCNPYILKPVNPANYSQQFPVFLPRCTQFIVEYAGDFLIQDPTNGNVNGIGADGRIDFLTKPVTPPTSPPSFQKFIRWYGLPRNVDTADDVTGIQIVGGLGGTRSPASPNLMLDVVPLRDVIYLAGHTPPASNATDSGPHWFERFENPHDLAMKANYAAAGAAGLEPTEEYMLYWAPSHPKPRMLRITFTLDDPSGRISEDGQSFEYVYELP
jgi:prepilin-type N-terminal cleavage/methylation domain-containing protein